MRRFQIAPFLIATLGLALLPAATWADEDSDLRHLRANVGYGPFDAISLSSFSSLRPGFIPLMPSSLGSGSFEARLAQSWAKVISTKENWLIDYEVLRTSLAAEYGISDSLSLGLEVDTRERTPGGALHHVILGFHHAFGISSSYIDPYPADYYRFRIARPGGGPVIDLEERDPEPFEAGALLELRQTLSYGGEVAPAVACGISLGRDLIQGNLRGGSPVDLAVSASASKGVGAFLFYAGADVEWFGRQTFFGMSLRPIQWTFLGGAEWHCLPRFSVIAQYLLKRGAVDHLEDFSLPSNEITAGIKWEFLRGALLSVAVLENVINPYNTPDFGVHVELSLRW